MTQHTIRFNAQTLNNLPLPKEGKERDEYKDLSIPNLRLYRYKTKVTWVFCTCHKYKAIKETLGHYPQLSVSDAKSLVMKRLQALECGEYVMQRKMTVNTFFDDFYMTDLRLNKRNTSSELSKCRRYLLQEYGNRTLLSITPSELSKYFLKLREQLSVATVNRIIAIFKKLFRLAIEHGYCTRSPVQHMKFMAENNLRHNVLSAVQARAFAAICKSIGSKGAIALYLSLMTGMRIGAVISLRTDKVNLIDAELIIKTTKNGSDYVVPLANEVVETLVEYVKTHSPTIFFFPSKGTSTGHIANPRGVFHSILSRMGIKGDYYIHDLRRTYATLMLQQTSDIQLVSQLLNHKTLATTQRYAHFSNTALKAKVQNIPLFSHDWRYS